MSEIEKIKAQAKVLIDNPQTVWAHQGVETFCMRDVGNNLLALIKAYECLEKAIRFHCRGVGWSQVYLRKAEEIIASEFMTSPKEKAAGSE